MISEIRELNRVTTTFSTTIRERALQIQGTLDTFGAAIEQAVGQLTGPSIAAATRPGSGGAPAAPLGIQLVRLVNDRATAVPVTIVSDLAAPIPVTMIKPPEPPQTVGQMVWSKITGFFASIPALISSFAGGFAGEVVSGIVKPFTGLVAGAELITVLGQVHGLLREVDSLLTAVTQAIMNAIDRLFDRLVRAGIFPIEELADTLIGLVRRALELIQPIFAWVAATAVELADWVTGLVLALGAWLGKSLNVVSAFLTRYSTYLLAAVVDPWLHRLQIRLLSNLLTVVVAPLNAVGNILMTLMQYAVARLEHIQHAGAAWFARSVNQLAEKLGVDYRIEVPTVGAEPKAPDLGAVWQKSLKEAQFASRELVESLIGEAPPAPAKAPKMGALPVFVQPMPQLPQLMTPEQAAEAAAAGQPAIVVTPAAPIQVAPAKAGPAAARGGITINGGVTVQVRADTVDLAHADDTGRRMAATLLDELDRLVQRHGFRRGVATEPAQ